MYVQCSGVRADERLPGSQAARHRPIQYCRYCIDRRASLTLCGRRRRQQYSNILLQTSTRYTICYSPQTSQTRQAFDEENTLGTTLVQASARATCHAVAAASSSPVGDGGAAVDAMRTLVSDMLPCRYSVTAQQSGLDPSAPLPASIAPSLTSFF